MALPSSLVNFPDAYQHRAIHLARYIERRKRAGRQGRTGPILNFYFFCQGAGVVSGQPFSIGSFSSKDQAIQDPS